MQDQILPKFDEKEVGLNLDFLHNKKIIQFLNDKTFSDLIDLWKKSMMEINPY